MRNFKIGSGEAAMRFNGDDESAAITWNGTESYSITAGGLRLRNVATASLPADPPDGTMVYDTTAQVVKVWDGSAWNAVGSAIAAGSGIDFSANTGTAATGAATTSELLDWYEEGTWTPNLWDASLSSSESQTYSTQSGKFTRIGNAVTFAGSATLTSLGTLTTSDQALIGPLPFAASTNPRIFCKADISSAVTTFTLGFTGRIVVVGALSYILLYTATQADPVTIADIGASGVISVSGLYYV